MDSYRCKFRKLNHTMRPLPASSLPSMSMKSSADEELIELGVTKTATHSPHGCLPKTM